MERSRQVLSSWISLYNAVSDQHCCMELAADSLCGFSFIMALLIGSILLLLTAGFLNSVITTFLWFEASNGFSKLLAHGIALFFVLCVLDSILITVSTLTFPGSAATAITFAVGTIAMV